MKLGIGIDTGGTCTDAVIYEVSSNRILAKAKALTTPEDLSIGISNALDGLPKEQFPHISVVALSTTLATNACVENKGGRAKLVCMGLYPKVVRESGKKYGLPDGDEIYFCDADTTFSGRINQEPNWEEFIQNSRPFLQDADSIGLVEIYAMNNGAVLEKKAKEKLEKEYGVPVIISGELFSDLNSLQRGASTLLNARLIPIIQDFIKAIHKALEERNIHAEVVIMRSDSSLMSEAFAAQRPVETLVCGPAASAMGGLALTGEKEGIIVDMGGTTTDIALLENARPVQSEKGICVGKWRTFVKGLDIDTFALGGDTAIRHTGNGELELGSRRIVPISLLAKRHPEILATLREISLRERPHTKLLHEFYTLVREVPEEGRYFPQETALCHALEKGPLILAEAAEAAGTDLYNLHTERLESEGVVIRAGLTPTDIMHLKGDFSGYCTEAAEYAARFVAVCTGRTLEQLCDDVYDLICKKIYTNIVGILLKRRYGELEESLLPGIDFLIEQSWANTAENSTPHLLDFSFSTVPPLIGIGAPTHIFLEKVAKRLHTRCVIPENAEVANAVGALAGKIRASCQVPIKRRENEDGESRYFVYARDRILDAEEKEEAIALAEKEAEVFAVEEARRRGAVKNITVHSHVSDRIVTAGNQISVELGAMVECTAEGSFAF